IDVGMPLQVDAPFYYLIGKGSSELTRDDLDEVSVYNTYVNKGLPVAPISNPGVDSIRAALNPTKSTYFFYLADSKGVTHYAVTHEAHVANKFKYLQ
ncbi:MAG: endolytic transglycosylase MltG, partial [bacterium]|nr:endolytic transglycosylase MltG [bacterium]